MKRSFITKALIAALIVLTVVLSAVSCGNNPADSSANKEALMAEIALEITEQGDYTAASYNAYVAKLGEAKDIADDAAATQDAVDKALAALSEARLALAVRTVETVEGGKKEITIIPDTPREIVIADYINTNGLSKITYTIKASNAVVSVGEVANGKFAITAGSVNKPTDLTLSIAALYDGVEKAKVELTVHISDDVAPTLKGEEIVKEYDLLTYENKDEVTIDFAENVNNPSSLELIYTVKRGDEALELDGSRYVYSFGSYTTEYAYETFSVTVAYTANGVSGTLEYTYKLGVRDTRAYGVQNGGFENGLDGWTYTSDDDAPFGGIDNKDTFWDQGFAMNNVGNYFSAYAEGAHEASMGTLASPYFVAKGDYATYMLGGAGNPNVYITIENKAGEVLALYRNTKFRDLPAGEFTLDEQFAMVGATVFVCNLVTYKVSISEFEGEEVRFVIHDHASSGWGVVFFDELVTYYSDSESVPENAVLAENLLADKTELLAEIALGVTEQGDYTADSYAAYSEKLAEAKLVAANVAATEAEVDAALEALTALRKALALRPVLAVENDNNSHRLISGDSLEIILADYINANGLSKITYELLADKAALIIGTVSDGKFTVTAADVDEAADVTLTIGVYYDNSLALTVTLTFKVTNDEIPVLLEDEIVSEYDVYELGNKESILLDLSKNVYSTGSLALSYSVSYGGSSVNLDGSEYTFNLGEYNDKTTNEVITVTVSYTANSVAQSITYTYILKMTDSTAYRLANGGFENGLDGWDKVGNIGDVSTDKNYWVEEWENNGLGYEFGMDGEYMFSAYAPGALESAVGTLTSSTFTVGGSGFVTFKLGAMKDGNYVYVDVVDAETKEILARYYNGLWADTTDGLKSGCTLVAYKADLSEFMGKEVFFRISDNADSGYGLFFADSFNTYYVTEPEGFNDATPVNYEVSGTIYDLFNGGFEYGDVQGWWNNGVPGKVTGAEAFFSGVAYGKDGNFLYSGVEDFGSGVLLEGNMGVLTSSVFELGGNGYITYMLGGGNALCYVQVIDAVTGEILARYRQQVRNDAVLVTYVADLTEYIGRTLRIQVVDKATSDWGCVSFDNVVTYYDTIPEGLSAIDVKGELVNGSFEDGNLNGWTMNITEAGAHNTLGWVADTEIDAEWYAKNDGTKDGSFLFTFVTTGDVNCENTKGTLSSSTFVLEKNSYVAFRFGGAGAAVNHDVHVQLCLADGTVIATFYNDAEGKVNTRMNAYYYQYTAELAECFFRVVDNSTGDYGCFVVDDFRVNLDEAPEGFIPAIQ